MSAAPRQGSAPFSSFASVPSFEFEANGTNVVAHDLVTSNKRQPWKQHVVLNKDAGAVIRVQPNCVNQYGEQGGRGGF